MCPLSGGFDDSPMVVPATNLENTFFPDADASLLLFLLYEGGDPGGVTLGSSFNFAAELYFLKLVLEDVKEALSTERLENTGDG